METAICPQCGRRYFIRRLEIEEFGRNPPCIQCLDRDHLGFMQKNAKRLGLSCVPGCFCGFGATT